MNRKYGGRSLLGVLVAAASLIAGTAGLLRNPSASAQVNNAGPAGSTAELAEWSEQVWSARGAGVREILLHPPEVLHEVADLAPLREGVARAQQNSSMWEEKRIARVGEIRGELQTALGNGELVKALRSANELYELETDRDAVRASEEVSRLIRESDAAARRHEAEGRWLDAQSLFVGLHYLHEEEKTYEGDVKRVGQRLQMMRLYVPEALHELRSAQRVAEGEEPLPPYNALGEDWRTKLDGINDRTIVAGILAAGERHLFHVGMGEMLLGGLEAIRTMVTTRDLEAAFPGLKDAANTQKLLAAIDQQVSALKQAADAGAASDAQDVFAVIRGLMMANRDSVGIDPRALLHEFGNGAMSRLDDYSTFIWPYEVEGFQRTTEGKFTGVGIQITLDEAFQLKVVTPLSGTPAARAGIRPGDLIRKIDGESTLGIALSQAVDRITGRAGTEVTLSLEREGQDGLLEFKLTRAEIPIFSVKGWKRSGEDERSWDWFIDPDHKIGYVRLTQFSRETHQELRDAISSMLRDGMQGLILDLRYNPGGLLDEAVNVTSLFVPSGTVVTQEDADGNVRDHQQISNGTTLIGDRPMIVLVNDGSASASEIVAGCLQDYRKALLVGERTFGKGSVQNVMPLPGGITHFKLTTQYYRLPGGRLIHHAPGATTWGVEPDVTVTMLPGQIEESLKLRQDADVVDASGTPLADPSRLLYEGIDPQLDTALLMIQSRVLVEQAIAGKS